MADLDYITRIDPAALNLDASVIRLSSYGVTASVASDQSALVQAAIDDLSNGMSLICDVTGSVRVDSTVTFLDLRNINVYGLTPVGYTDINEPTFKLVWYGANGGTVLRIDRVRNSIFRGIGIFGSAVGGANGADVGCFLTQNGSGSNISTNNVLEFNTYHANSTRSGWIGLKIDNTSLTNNEQHTVADSLFVGGQQAFPNQTGSGIYLGHANVKQIVIRHCARTGLAKFVNVVSGSFRAEYNYGGAGAVAYYGNIVDAISIVGDESESDKQILSLTGTGSAGTPVSLIGCRFEDLRGGQVASGTTSVDPVISITSCPLTVIGSAFSGQSNFTKDFIKESSQGSSVQWLNNKVYNLGDSNKLTPQYLLDVGLGTFGNGYANDVYGSRWFGVKNVISNVMTRPTSRSLIQSVPTQPNELPGYIPAALNSLILGTGEVEIVQLARPNKLTAAVVGTPGSTSYLLAVLARDALTNRSLVCTLNDSIGTANATLSGSNYIQLDWPAVPNATDYVVLQYSGGTWRSVATVTASGTDYETYNIVANPGGAFTYVIPTFNETVQIIQRGRQVTPVEIAFTSTDATPSVAIASDFVTANASATSITTFDDGITGQLIRVRVNDANTTFVNGSGIITRTGANVAGTNGLIYQFIRRSGNWCQL